jgi:PII-like signaling protein
MKLLTEARLLRVFIGESDKFEGRPLYQVIVERARRRELAGATVLRGYLGFGANSRIHSARVLRLSEDLPMVIEIVDEPERINAFVAELDEIIGEGLVTLEKVEVILYRHGSQA